MTGSSFGITDANYSTKKFINANGLKDTSKKGVCMANQGSPQGHKPHLRFYIFMVTLAIGGLFFLLYLNDGESPGNSLISAITGYASANATEDVNATMDPAEELDQEFNKLLNEGGKLKNYRSVPLTLSFNRVPVVQKEARIREVELEFDDLSTTIIVNGDKLELKNLKKVKLSIEDFAGMVNFGSSELSLSGTARRIEVNDIAFSSEKEVPILFQGLNYRHLHISDLELKDLELNRGDGELTVGEKLRYILENEELKILYFIGSLTIDQEARNATALVMEGDAKGLYTGGELLTFTLR